MFACRGVLLRNGTNTYTANGTHRIHSAVALHLDEPTLLHDQIINKLKPLREVESHCLIPFNSVKPPHIGCDPSFSLLKAVVDQNLCAISVESHLLQELSLIHSHMMNEAGIQLAESHPKDAISLFENSSFPSAAFNLALIYERHGEVSKSLKYLKKASRMNHSGALFNLAVHYNKKGDSCTAKNYMVRAAKAGNRTAQRIVYPKNRTNQG